MKTPKQIKRWLYKARLRACVWEYPLEKFAQLIVKECIPFVGDPASEAVKKMMKHFGMNDALN